MKYISTRNKTHSVSGLEAIVNGLAPDGGLYVPESFPQINLLEMRTMVGMSYPERSAYIIDKFVPEFGYAKLLEFANLAYAKFDEEAAPVVKLDSDVYLLELWHGPTHAFKDIALTMLPYLMTESKARLGRTDKTLVLVATSGDTGKAALEGFKDVEGTEIMVLYPSDGVSKLQKLQMKTQLGDNVMVAAIDGNFDDAQTAVKTVFTDKAVAELLAKSNITLSSANSINWGRLVPQVAYYFSAYLDLVDADQVKMGDKINFCVPTGNFGNILAGYYAMKMGLPVGKLICASNDNNVLTDFFSSGEYDTHREFVKTISPSMDILISSNLERLVFEISGRDDLVTGQRLSALKSEGKYEISREEVRELAKVFYANYSEEDVVRDTLANFFEEYGYIADTHTSVALSVFNEYSANCADETKTVIVSTASPYKFVDDVLIALDEKPASTEYKSLKKLEELTALPIPETLSNLPKMDIRFDKVISTRDVKDEVLAFALRTK